MGREKGKRGKSEKEKKRKREKGKREKRTKRKIQIEHSIGSNFGTTSLSSKFTIRWRHHLVTKFVPNSSYRSNAWFRFASGNVLLLSVSIQFVSSSAGVKSVKFHKRLPLSYRDQTHRSDQETWVR